MATDKVVPLHRGIYLAPEFYAEHLQVEQPEATFRDAVAGALEAVGDFINTPQFMAGCWFGMAFVCVAAWVVAF